MSALIALVYSYLGPAFLDALDTGLELDRSRRRSYGGNLIGCCCAIIVVIIVVIVVIVMRRRGRPRE